MLVPLDPSHLVAPLAGGAAICFIGGLFAVSSTLPRRLWQSCRGTSPSHTHVTHRCCYCLWGDARLVQETVRRENDEVVEVRCYACNGCGFPHWTVQRIPIAELARRQRA
jgi:hypothetical protein